MPDAARLGEELGAEADQPARGDEEVEPHPAGAVVDHVLHPALAQREHLRDHAEEVLGHVDRQPLDRLVQLPSISRVTTCGLPTVSSKPSRRIVSTSTASCSSPRPWTSQVSGRSVSSTRIATLPTSSCAEPVSHHARGQPACPTGRRAASVLMPIVIPSAGSSTAITGSGRGSSGSAIVSPIVISGMPASAMISPGPAASAGRALRAPRSRRARRPSRARSMPSRRHQATCWPLRDRRRGARGRARGGRRSVGVEVRHARLERVALLVLGRGHVLEQQVEQRAQVGALGALLERRPSRPSRSCRRSGTRSAPRRRRGRGTARRPRPRPRRCARPGRSTLFTHEHHRQPRLERLAQHEAGLGQRALGGVDEQHHAVDHRQPALDLAAEVGVAGRVDEVELHVAGSGRRRSWRGS